MNKCYSRHALAGVIGLVAVCACAKPPARLVAGSADTVIVNSRRPVQIPVRVLDAAGRVLDSTSASFRWLAGDSISVSPTGEVSCTRNADAAVHVAHGALTTQALVRCRPVQWLGIDGPINLVFGDSAQPVSFKALGSDGQHVTPVVGDAEVYDSSVAALDRAGGLSIRARRAGITMVEIRVGDLQAHAGVHAYERVSTLDGLRADQVLVALPLRLARGERHQWSLRPGSWMVAMLPTFGSGPSFRIEGAECRPFLTERRYACEVGVQASVTVYHPGRPNEPSTLNGELLLRHLHNP